MTPLESVIEWKFAAQLRDFGIGLCEFWTEETMEAMATRMVTEQGCALAASPQVQCGPYRVDFLFVVESFSDKPFLVAVECDGHDFHERTKEQAQRDKSRDRELAAMGVQVLRYTGSEITRNARACVIEVLDLMIKRRHQAWMTTYPETVALIDAKYRAEASA